PRDLVEKNLAAERATFDSFHEFFFGVYSASYRFDDFDRKDSMWRIALVTESGETAPVSVERIGRSTLNLRAIYHYMGDSWVAYLFRFAENTATGAPVIPRGTTRFMVRGASTVARAALLSPADKAPALKRNEVAGDRSDRRRANEKNGSEIGENPRTAAK